MGADEYINDQVRTLRFFYRSMIDAHPGDNGILNFMKAHTRLMWEAFQGKDASVAVEFSNHHPDLIGEPPEKIMSYPLTLADCEMTVLDQYGFVSWEEAKDAGTFQIPFEQAVNAVVHGNILRLDKQIRAHPEIVRMKSQFGHKAGLIHYIAANGVEIWRQIVSSNAPEVLELLLFSGADPDQKNNIYGGSGLRTLIETSDHPFRAGVGNELLRLLENNVK